MSFIKTEPVRTFIAAQAIIVAVIEVLAAFVELDETQRGALSGLFLLISSLFANFGLRAKVTPIE